MRESFLYAFVIMMNMELTYGSCEKKDIQAVYELQKKLILRYEDPSVQDIDKALQWSLTKIEANWETYTRVMCDGKICAYYHLVEGLDLRNELDDFYVLPSFRNQGIGTMILDHIIEESEDPVYLYVYQKNRIAIHMYEKAGFMVTRILSPTRMIMERK